MSETREPYADELPDLFSEAIALDPIAREAMLRSLRVARPALAARLDELLAADRDAGAFLERPLATPGVSATLAVGDVVEGFRIEASVASGANGSVYRATQDYPRRTVALKVLHFALPSAGAVARFRQEVRTLARLSHPGIVPLFAAGVIEPETRALPWFAMELIDGAKDLRTWARAQPIEARVKAIAEACDAVHHAHLKGVVHRDLKPGNILVGSDGRPRVIDFGVATSTGSAAALATHIGSLTPEGAVVGTLAYMSPEQLEASRDIDARADIYALGVILYEICTGRLPFELGRTPAQAMRAIALDVAIDPVRAAPHERALRGDLAAVLLRAIERDPTRRYGSAAEFGADLVRWMQREPVLARRPGFAERSWRAMRRRPVLSTAVALTAVAATGITVTSVIGASIAYREAMRAQRYITGLLSALEDPAISARGREPRMADAADAIVRAVASTSLPKDEEADGRMIAGRIYELLGLWRESIDQYQRALALRNERFGVASSEALEALAAIGRVTAVQRNPTGPIADAESVEGIAAAFRALVSALGWRDPRTVDALGWSADALGDEDLLRALDEIAASDAPPVLGVPARANALITLVQRPTFLQLPRASLLLRAFIESASQCYRNGVTEGVVAVANLAYAIHTAPEPNRATLLPELRDLAQIVLPAISSPDLPLTVGGVRRRFASALAGIGDDDGALRLLQLNLRAAVGENPTERGIRHGSGLVAAQILLRQGKPGDARAQLAWMESEPDSTDVGLSNRQWRVRTLATQARAARLMGDAGAALALAARCRALHANTPGLSPTGMSEVASNLGIAESSEPRP